MSRGITQDVIDKIRLGWTDEMIRLITGYELAWIQRMRKQYEEHEESKNNNWFDKLTRMLFKKGAGRNS